MFAICPPLRSSLYRSVLTIWLLCSGSLSAQTPTEPLEQQLEQYLHLSSQQPEQAAQLLLQLEQQVDADTPLRLQVRLLVYRAGELALQQQFSAAEQKLAQLLVIANNTEDADIKAEVMAEHLQQYWDRSDISKAVSFPARQPKNMRPKPAKAGYVILLIIPQAVFRCGKAVLPRH